MKSAINVPQNIDEYISPFPIEIRKILNEFRSIIRKAAPEAVEKISYQMPTFALKGNLVHFAACKNHIGFYPAPSGIENFRKELSVYTLTKGSIHLPLDAPLPASLITKIVEFRVNENLQKTLLKQKK